MENVLPNEVFISKLQVQDKVMYIKLVWKQNEHDLFHIKVLDEDISWSGSFSNDTAKSFRERDNIDETKELYSANVKKSLTGEDDSYTFDLVISSDDTKSASFNWKKRIQGNNLQGKGFNVVHGKVSLHRDATPVSKDLLIDHLLSKNKHLQNDIKEHTSKSEGLISELETCKSELEKYVNVKTSLESTLYGKFVQLLNAKKRRIQLLEDNLLNFEEPNNATMGSELD